ncbi:MAG: hypothetical protein ABEK59_01675 [Halobacteria archaeon]
MNIFKKPSFDSIGADADEIFAVAVDGVVDGTADGTAVKAGVERRPCEDLRKTIGTTRISERGCSGRGS